MDFKDGGAGGGFALGPLDPGQGRDAAKKDEMGSSLGSGRQARRNG